MKLRDMGTGSWMVISAPVTDAAAPPTEAAPDRTAFSPTSEKSSSIGAVILKLPLPLVCSAEMVMVKESPFWLVVKSSPAPRTAPPPPVTVTSTSVEVLSREEEPANRAVTAISRGVPLSTTDPWSTERAMAESSSCTVTAAVAFSNRDVPSSSNVSGPSTTASWVMVSPVNLPGTEEETDPAGMVTVLGAVGE